MCTECREVSVLYGIVQRGTQHRPLGENGGVSLLLPGVPSCGDLS